jgi:predicted methyltransferase
MITTAPVVPLAFANVGIAAVDDEFTAEGNQRSIDLAQVGDDVVAEFDVAQKRHRVGGHCTGHVVQILPAVDRHVDYLTGSGGDGAVTIETRGA